MKKVIITALLVTSVSLLATESTQIDGKNLFEQRCVVCHGATGNKIPTGASSAIAGRDVRKLVLDIRAYQNQHEDIGAYTMKKDSQIMKDATSSLSQKAINALAIYINTLK